MNKQKLEIIKSLSKKPKQSFNELWNKKGESNAFAYHIKNLLNDKIIEKKDERYNLTKKGKKIITYGNDNSLEMPFLGVLIVIFNERGEVLKYERKKEPFFGYLSFQEAKLNLQNTF